MNVLIRLTPLGSPSPLPTPRNPPPTAAISWGPRVAGEVARQGRRGVPSRQWQTNEEVETERDARRTAWLESQGLRVVRFWNFQVIEEIEEVIETIWLALSESTPHPNPPPQGGREILGPWRRETLG